MNGTQKIVRLGNFSPISESHLYRVSEAHFFLFGSEIARISGSDFKNKGLSVSASLGIYHSPPIYRETIRKKASASCYTTPLYSRLQLLLIMHVRPVVFVCHVLPALLTCSRFRGARRSPGKWSKTGSPGRSPFHQSDHRTRRDRSP